MSAADLPSHNGETPIDPKAQPLALFDLDGTLTDPTEGIMTCHRWALSELDVPFPTDVHAASVVGVPAADAHATLGVPAALVEQTTAKYRERFAIAGWLDDTPYPGISELLHALSAAGWQLGVVATKLELIATRVIERVALTDHFAVIAGADPKTGRTDKRAIIQHAVNQLEGAPAGGVAVIGDRRQDIDAAKSLQMTGIGAGWGFGAIDELIAANADAVALAPEDIREILLDD